MTDYRYINLIKSNRPQKEINSKLFPIFAQLLILIKV